MRLINADELMEHVWRDKLDSREAIAEMINNAPTVEMTATFWGYNVEELHKFAVMCRSAGITEDELHSFIQDAMILVKVIQEETKKSLREALKKMMERTI